MEWIWVPVADKKNPNGFRLEKHPILFPHRILTYLFEVAKLDIDMAVVHRYWDHAIEAREPYASADSRDKIPVGLYGDGAQLITKIRKEKVWCLFFNLPLFRPCSIRYSRFLLWCCDASLLHQNKTTNTVLRWVTWSLNCAYDGLNPTGRPGGRPLSKNEAARAGTPLTSARLCFQCVEFRGDWEYHKLLWKLSSSWVGNHVCFRCPALAQDL